MAQPSLGLIETIGLVAAVEAADAAVKSANVVLVGYELTKGDGMTVVKVQGEVGAVNAAVAAGVAAASKVGRVASSRVIARPAQGIEKLVANADTVGSQCAEAIARERCAAVAVPAHDQGEAEPENAVTTVAATAVATATERDVAPVAEASAIQQEAVEEDQSGTEADTAAEPEARNPEARDALVKGEAQGSVKGSAKAQTPNRGAAVSPPPRRTSEKLPTKNRKHRKTKE